MDVEGIDLSGVNVRCADFPEKLPKGAFSGEEFFHHLNKGTGTKVWVMTHTISLFCPLYIPVERIIYEFGEIPNAWRSICRQLKTHVKLFVQLQDNKVVAVYTGSMNLVNPSNLNLMVRLPKTTHEYWKNYYTHYWVRARK